MKRTDHVPADWPPELCEPASNGSPQPQPVIVAFADGQRPETFELHFIASGARTVAVAIIDADAAVALSGELTARMCALAAERARNRQAACTA